MTRAMNRDAVVKTYDRWAPVYDFVFGSVFEKARRAAIAACEEVGGRVLEVGPPARRQSDMIYDLGAFAIETGTKPDRRSYRAIMCR